MATEGRHTTAHQPAEFTLSGEPVVRAQPESLPSDPRRRNVAAYREASAGSMPVGAEEREKNRPVPNAIGNCPTQPQPLANDRVDSHQAHRLRQTTTGPKRTMARRLVSVATQRSFHGLPRAKPSAKLHGRFAFQQSGWPWIDGSIWRRMRLGSDRDGRRDGPRTDPEFALAGTGAWCQGVEFRADSQPL